MWGTSLENPFRTTARMMALALVGTAGIIGGTGGAADAATSQLTIIDHTGAQTASNYWQPSLNQPADYTRPDDYAGGHTYVKLVVLDKPSDKLVWPQLCFWRHTESTRFKFETCSPSKAFPFSSEGTYYADLGAMNGWWKKNGVYDWSKPASVGRIMLKDPVTKKLLIGSRCGAACYPGGDLDEHVPVRFHAEVITVAKGATLAPPSDWRAGCPAGWSPQCDGSGSDPAPPEPPNEPGSDSPTTPDLTVTESASSLDISWPAVDGATKYQVKWKRLGQTKWNWIPISDQRSHTVNGLTAGTYEVQARALIGGTWRDWAEATAQIGSGASSDGSGGGAGTGSTAPDVTVDGSSTSFTVSWPAVDGATKYQVKWKRRGRTRWNWIPISGQRSHTVDGLTAGTYDVQVRALIDGTWRDWAQARTSVG